MKVVILGVGRTGCQLALYLDELGAKVSVIDKNRQSFHRLGKAFKGACVGGLGIDVDTLKRAGIEEADIFVAVSGGDNTNIMASQIARDMFHVKRVICRIVDPKREKAYRSLGLETFPSTTLTAGLLLKALLEEKPDYLELEKLLEGKE